MRWGRGWRVALRIAGREAWRPAPARRRSALVAVLVGLPVLAASGMATLIVGQAESGPGGYLSRIPAGAQASLSVMSWGHTVQQDVYATSASASEDPVATVPLSEVSAALRAVLPAGDQVSAVAAQSVVGFAAHGSDRFTVDTVAVGQVVGDSAPGSSPGPEVWSASGLTLRSGRWPQARGEVVVSAVAARLLSAAPGATLALGRITDPAATPTTYTVVGTADSSVSGSPPRRGVVAGLLGDLPGSQPGSLPAAMPTATAQLTVTGPAPVTPAQAVALNRMGVVVVSRAVIEDALRRGLPEGTVLGDAAAAGQVSLPQRIGTQQDDDDLTRLLQAEVAGLVLLQLVLLAAPAMAVGARRRERALALAAVAGADRAQVRRIVLALGAVMAAPGSLIGALGGAGFAVWAAGRWDAVGNRNQPLDVPWLLVAGLAVAGVAIAVLAALVPAVISARLDPVAVLRGRRGAPPPRRGAPWLGAGLVVAGTAVTVAGSWATSMGTRERGAVTVLGIALAEVGLLLCLPVVLAVLARVADRGPLAVRLALRDADRHRLRTVPAVAAAIAAIAGSIAGIMYVGASARAEAQVQDQRNPPGAVALSIDGVAPPTAAEFPRWHDQALRTLAGTGIRALTPVWTFGADTGSWSTSPVTGADQAQGTTWAGRRADALPSPQACTQDVPRASPSPGTTASAAPEVIQVPMLCQSAGQRLRRPALDLGVVVGDAGTVRALTGEDVPTADRALASGRAVVSDPDLVWPDGTLHVVIHGQYGSQAADVPVIRFEIPATVVTAPVAIGPVLPVDAVARLAPSAIGLLAAGRVITDRVPDDTGALDALEIMAPVAMREYRPDPDALGARLAILALAVFVTAFGAASAVALAAAEGRADAATLAAVGAAPRTRRRLAAMQSLVIAGLGGIGGVVSGLLAGWALIQVHRTSELGPSAVAVPGGQPVTPYWSGWQVTIPWAESLVLGIGLPLLLAAGAYVLTRSRLPRLRQVT